MVLSYAILLEILNICLGDDVLLLLDVILGVQLGVEFSMADTQVTFLFISKLPRKYFR